MFPLTSRPIHDVFILGAGFSKAISASMPLTDALGDATLDRLGEHSPNHSPFTGGYFEAWLSRIGEDQPDLSVADNLANRALFQRCSDALADVLIEATTTVTQDEVTSLWLQRFLRLLHARRATVITFNQDLLLERATDAAELFSWEQASWPLVGEQPQLTWHQALDLRPPVPPGRLEADPLPTFRLLKLHGSANWYWRPGDQSGSTIVRWRLPGGAEGSLDDAADRRRTLPGRVPMIVPPAAAKSTYYQAPLITQLWQEAHQAMQQQDARLHVMGYSLPITDLVTSGMLREAAFARRPDLVPTTVVNPDPGPVVSRLRNLGAAQDTLHVHESIPAFIDEYEQIVARDLVSELRELRLETDDALLLVGTKMNKADKVVGFEYVSDGLLRLHLEDHPAGHRGITVQGPSDPRTMTMSDLMGQLHRQAVDRIGVRRGDRPYDSVIIGAASHQTNLGAGSGRWQILIPSTPLPG